MPIAESNSATVAKDPSRNERSLLDAIDSDMEPDRDAAREVSPPRGEEATAWVEPLGSEPTPHEAAVLTETIEQLCAGLDEDERPILELSLQGYTTREISERLGRAERTVRLLREGIRHRLERMQRDNA